MKTKPTVLWAVFGLAVALFFACSPAFAQSPPASPPAVVTNGAFGEEVTFPSRSVLHREWEIKFSDTWAQLVEMFKELRASAEQLGLKVTGPGLVIYSWTEHEGKIVKTAPEVALPVEGAPNAPPAGGLAIGPGPTGKAVKFVHRGDFGNLVSTYASILDFLESQKIESGNFFVEEYATDPVTTKPEEVVINIYVPKS